MNRHRESSPSGYHSSCTYGSRCIVEERQKDSNSEDQEEHSEAVSPRNGCISTTRTITTAMGILMWKGGQCSGVPPQTEANRLPVAAWRRKQTISQEALVLGVQCRAVSPEVIYTQTKFPQTQQVVYMCIYAHTYIQD